MKVWSITGAVFLLPLYAYAAEVLHVFDSKDDHCKAHKLILQISENDSLNLKEKLFLSLTIAARYDRKALFQDLVEMCVGNRRIELPNHDFCCISNIDDAIEIDQPDADHLYGMKIEESDFAKATAIYLELLQQDDIFSKENWSGNLHSRMAEWQWHVDFLRDKRATLFMQKDKLIRYDLLDNTITIFAYEKNGSKIRFAEPRYATVPKNINPYSIRLEDNEQDITYTLFSPDSIVEGSEDG
jgi:hypothetical protein